MNNKALQKISYGLYVICSEKHNRINGQIANAIFQVTADPPAIAVSINKENCTHEYIEHSKLLSISVLSQDTPMTFIGTFGFKCGRDIDKFDGIKYGIGKTGLPFIKDYSIAYYETHIFDSVDVGTHTIFIGDVVEAEIISDNIPMTYEYYHEIKGGFSPKTAPTYVKKEEITK